MKLRKLILSGFKSFADKTELEFDDGISCIVGPNGCGKSNIVDAVKWVLGEQSAKSLRGSEMMDVIFNGSSTRRASGGAEITLVFDNSSGLLRPMGTEEQVPSETVSITRRLFRSSQSEYFINKIPCRLRDIREMLMDTGNAYSFIEQGRVEGFLQAGHEERRAIFDEAAGISKYKARRKETLRKLERVGQNLLRIQDIFSEVEKRLRSIKYQAGKARNYQTYSERLKELRSLFFLAQYHKLWAQRGELQKRLDESSDVLAQLTGRIDRLEAARSAAEVEAVDLERSQRDLGARIAAVSGQITATQERSDMLASRIEELTEQILSASGRCETLEAKIEDVDHTSTTRQSELDQITDSVTDLTGRYDTVCREHHDGELAITKSEATLADQKAGTIDLLRRTAQLHNEIHSLDIHRGNLQSRRDRLNGRSEEIDQSLGDILAARSELQTKLSDVEGALGDAHERLDKTRCEIQVLHENEAQLRNNLGDAREQRSAVASRMNALGEMQKSMEGVNAGVRRVLEAHRAGGLAPVMGMLGEFIQADIQHVQVVESALAGADQQILVQSFDATEAASAEFAEILGNAGTVEVLCLDRLEPLYQNSAPDDCPEVIACVIDWVQFEAQVAPVIWRILGRTLVVQTLQDAAAASRRLHNGFRFVTLSGEVLEPDGRIRIGAANRSAGVIKRRSELVDLQGRQEQLDRKICELQQQSDSAQGEVKHLDDVQQKLRTAIYEANTERVECRTRLMQLDEQLEKLKREKPLITADLESIAADIDEALHDEHDRKQTATELERHSADRQAEVERIGEQIAEYRQRQGDLTERMTEFKVAMVQSEEKARSLRDSLRDLERQHDQMERDLKDSRSEIELNLQRRAEAQGGIEAARQQIDDLYEQQQELNRQADDASETRRGLNERLEDIKEEFSAHRRKHASAADQVNTMRIELGEADVRIENLITRASDEMSMDLLDLYKTYQHDEQRDWDSVESEIKELRGKIERLGNVNLDAICEQEELEQRKEFLTGQLQDVESSQNQLNELIRRINRESRDLFAKMFGTVRVNFQELFRKLFGGGRADIFLTDPDNVLESGIEIVARPPGKELRTLSLLSGGEKTMTALALLFSIFRAKPSPFCLLDEVDAALDETNTERFARLLQEFNDQTQFVIISHAKRTMSMANILYGVTMEEPGVSKRISVRFEDVGHRLESQLEQVNT